MDTFRTATTISEERAAPARSSENRANDKLLPQMGQRTGILPLPPTARSLPLSIFFKMGWRTGKLPLPPTARSLPHYFISSKKGPCSDILASSHRPVAAPSNPFLPDGVVKGHLASSSARSLPHRSRFPMIAGDSRHLNAALPQHRGKRLHTL